MRLRWGDHILLQVSIFHTCSRGRYPYNNQGNKWVIPFEQKQEQCSTLLYFFSVHFFSRVQPNYRRQNVAEGKHHHLNKNTPIVACSKTRSLQATRLKSIAYYNTTLISVRMESSSGVFFSQVQSSASFTLATGCMQACDTSLEPSRQNINVSEHWAYFHLRFFWWLLLQEIAFTFVR